jgi:Leu/Phe-tRNA-protein transferase
MIYTEYGQELGSGLDYGRLAGVLLAAQYPGEFLFDSELSGDSVERASLAGFMPMSARLPQDGFAVVYLAAKLHTRRCVALPASLRPTKSALRDAKRYSLGLNGDFDATLAGCVARHGDDWLSAELCSVFRELARERQARRIKMLSAELYEDGEPVAGEIGYLIGSAYASLSGYTLRSGAGTVQLYALAALLAREGLRLWDLGMPLEYKLRLGARVEPRAEFMDLIRNAYAQNGRSVLAGPLEPLPAAELLAGLA